MNDITKFRLEAADQVFESLTNASISWAVMHGGEGYPVAVGRDFDVLVEENDRIKASKIVEKILVKDGWKVCFVPLPWNVTQVIASKHAPCGIVAFEIDFVSYLTWHGIGLVDGPFEDEEVEIRNGLRCAVWAGFVKRVLIQCLTGNWEKLASKPQEWSLIGQEEKFVPGRLGHFVDVETARHFLSALRGGDVEELKKATQALRRKVFFRSVYEGRVFKGVSIQWIKDKVAGKLLLRQRAPVVDIFFSPEIEIHLVKDILKDFKATVKKRLVFAQVRLFSEKERRGWGFDSLLNSANVNLTMRQKGQRIGDRNKNSLLNVDVLSVSLRDEKLRMVWNDEDTCHEVTQDEGALLFCDLVMKSMHQLCSGKGNS